ncbi:MAG: hypothetical protein CTY37_07290 [Methylotenera sp.]|nr:MAG: hypothetical protein CTY37_07290 [Methylotenera sp.]
MNHFILTASIIGLLSLTACDKPTVVNVPAETVVVPGPAGPAGESGQTGATGDAGIQGETGEASGDTTIIIAPAETEPAPEPLKETE